VLRDLLGMDDARLAELAAAGVFGAQGATQRKQEALA